MELGTEKKLKELSALTRIRLILLSKATDTLPQVVTSVYEGTVGSLLVKTGGGKKGGRRLSAPIRREVIKHLDAGGAVDLEVF